jgi:DNA-binding transcriptional ArsR family regulator
MAIRLAINGGWIYLTPSEKKNMINCIKLLEDARTEDRRLHTEAFRRALQLNKSTTTHTLDLLKAAGIIKPEQYGRMRLYSLISGYKSRLRGKTKKIGRGADSQ